MFRSNQVSFVISATYTALGHGETKCFTMVLRTRLKQRIATKQHKTQQRLQRITSECVQTIGTLSDKSGKTYIQIVRKGHVYRAK